MAEQKKTPTQKKNTNNTKNEEPTIEEIKKMNVYEKIVRARNEIAVGKDSENAHMNYNYFSPDAVNNAVNPAMLKFRLFDAFNMEWYPEYQKYMAIYTLINMDDPEDQHVFTFYIRPAEIRSTDPAQADGGTLTYGKRYSQMNAFNIADPSLDLDSNKQTKAREDSKKQSSSSSKSKSKSSSSGYKKSSKQPSTKTKGSSKTSGSSDGAATASQIKFLKALDKQGKVTENVDYDNLTKEQASELINKAKQRPANKEEENQSQSKQDNQEDTQAEAEEEDPIPEEDDLPF